MEKVLSICVPSYNMEAFLPRNLDSILSAGKNDELEIIIVNDGSKDRTLDVANQYKNLYPNTVVVIDKPNGHYGSCVNSALKVASGKFFRTVDADDWVDSAVLSLLIERLNSVQADCVFTRFSQYSDLLGNTVLMPFANQNIQWDTDLSFDDKCISEDFFHMHCLTYNTKFLRDINYFQTEGICYTDSEYVFYPLVRTRSVHCINQSLYQYFIGRNDQSVAPTVLAKNSAHLIKIVERLICYTPPSQSCNYYYLYMSYCRILFTYLISIKISSYNRDLSLDHKLRELFERANDTLDIKEYLFATKSYRFHIIRDWYYDRALLLALYKFYKNLCVYFNNKHFLDFLRRDGTIRLFGK